LAVTDFSADESTLLWQHTLILSYLLADGNGTALDRRYRAYAPAWFWLGVPAFLSLIAVFWLMVAKSF